MSKDYDTRFFWNWVHNYWPGSAVFRVFAKSPDRSFGYTIKTVKDLEDFIQWGNERDFDLYWQINPTRRWGGNRCSTRDILGISFIPIDIDPYCAYGDPDPGAFFTLLPEWPGLVVDSGRGIQQFIPVEFHPFNQEWTPEVWQASIDGFFQGANFIAYGCSLDTSVSDAPRLMRLPGSINQKNGHHAFIDHVVPGDPFRYLPRVEPPIPAPLEGPPINIGSSSWIDFLPHLTVTARRFVEDGADQGDRHKWAFATMKAYRGLGAPWEVTVSAMRQGAAMSRPVLPAAELHIMANREMLRENRNLLIDNSNLDL